MTSIHLASWEIFKSQTRKAKTVISGGLRFAYKAVPPFCQLFQCNLLSLDVTGATFV